MMLPLMNMDVRPAAANGQDVKNGSDLGPRANTPGIPVLTNSRDVFHGERGATAISCRCRHLQDEDISSRDAIKQKKGVGELEEQHQWSCDGSAKLISASRVHPGLHNTDKIPASQLSCYILRLW